MQVPLGWRDKRPVSYKAKDVVQSYHGLHGGELQPHEEVPWQEDAGTCKKESGRHRQVLQRTCLHRLRLHSHIQLLEERHKEIANRTGEIAEQVLSIQF